LARPDNITGIEGKSRSFSWQIFVVELLGGAATLDLQTRDDAFLESAGDGFDRLHVVAGVRREVWLIH
jgi:hypothetical protein